MLEKLCLTQEVVEPLHRVGKLDELVGMPPVPTLSLSLSLTLAFSIAVRCLPISATWAFRSAFAAFFAEASTCRLVAEGVILTCAGASTSIQHYHRPSSFRVNDAYS